VNSDPRDGEHSGADLDELDALRHQRLVVAVGEFAAETRQEEERRDQRGAGNRDQHFGIRTGDLEQDDEDQRGLEEVVAECREELALSFPLPAGLHLGPGRFSPRLLRWS